MKTQTRVLTSVAASLAVSALIICIVYFIVRDMNNELARGRIYEEIMSKTDALNLMTATFQSRPEPSHIRQIRDIQRSLENLLGAMTYLDAREESLVRQIRTNSRELGYSLEKLISSHLGLGVGMKTERYSVLVSQLSMKTQFISDDTYRLKDISQSRTAAAQAKAGISILALIVALVLMNGAISFFSGRSIARMQEGLQEQRKWLQVTLASIGDGVIATDTESKIDFLNPVAAALTGWPIDEALGRPVQELFRIINEKTREPAEDIVRRVLDVGGTVALANYTVLVARDGREIPIEDSAAPIKDGTGMVAGVVLVFHDVTEKRRAREALLQSRQDLDRAQEVGQIGSWRLDVRRNVLTWSEENHRIFGVPKGTPMTYETFLGVVHPDDRQDLDTQWKAGLRGEPYDIEHRIVVGGLVKWVREKAYLEFDDAGDLLGGFGITQDITERKRAEQELRESEERIRASLGEKEVLLKEIHHRVKNNMQVISSLVALQADGLQDEAMRDALRDVTHRVRSMAMVHEKLYQSPDLARVAFDEYARSLLNYLWRAHGTEASGIRLALDLESVSLSVDTAVPCGLILNELVTNALKHAFRGRSHAEGVVAVSLRGGAQGQVCLGVRDNGTGLPAGFDWSQARTLGLRLVQMLAGQLHAAVELSSAGGTEFKISFEGTKE